MKLSIGTIIQHKVMPGYFVVIRNNYGGAFYDLDTWECRASSGDKYNFIKEEMVIEKGDKE